MEVTRLQCVESQVEKLADGKTDGTFFPKDDDDDDNDDNKKKLF